MAAYYFLVAKKNVGSVPNFSNQRWRRGPPHHWQNGVGPFVAKHEQDNPLAGEKEE